VLLSQTASDLCVSNDAKMKTFTLIFSHAIVNRTDQQKVINLSSVT